MLLLTWFIQGRKEGNMQTGSDDHPVSTKPGGREGGREGTTPAFFPTWWEQVLWYVVAGSTQLISIPRKHSVFQNVPQFPLGRAQGTKDELRCAALHCELADRQRKTKSEAKAQPQCGAVALQHPQGTHWRRVVGWGRGSNFRSVIVQQRWRG